ncbi:MAG TPA: Ni-sirohydrochlorin a,c-diamide synthase [Methanomicrobiales archaeon]|jgi:cobyrinic acid a,c-diamide synthase|nr:Ni-sirohydrochlorin a,c-diamide synthase [Methanomicrobiales archaeon]
MKALVISGDRSGTGKTSITLALASLLSDRMPVQAFKVGMDYIDPSYLAAVTRRPCRNLDSFVMGEEGIRASFAHGCEGADLALIEGVRGLYEGAEALTDAGSTAGVAKELGAPVVLVVNARSITRSAAALVKGFQAFDPAIAIRGVILNSVGSESHAKKAVTSIEHTCGIPVLGAIPHDPRVELTMRHLGLVPYREGSGHEGFTDRLAAVRELVSEHVDVDGVLACAADMDPARPGPSPFAVDREPGAKVGIAYDEAFNFYYADLFDLLPALGAEVVTFSPVRGNLPDADGYILGGGYPELFGPELEGNDGMKEALRQASLGGTPVYGECGGLMYLTDRIILAPGWRGGKGGSFGMCGVFAGETRMPAHRVVSYVEGIASAGSPLGSGPFRGHEFHYSDVVLDPGTRYTYRITRGQGIRDGLDGAVVRNTLGSYTHLHPLASLGMFRAFVEACRRKG